MRRAVNDGGSATVWATGALAAVLILVLAGIRLGSAIVARHQAESAADLAALAGAARARAGPELACDQARDVTRRMSVTLVSCRLEGADVLVRVHARPGSALLGSAAARARAGPAERGAHDEWQVGP